MKGCCCASHPTHKKRCGRTPVKIPIPPILYLPATSLQKKEEKLFFCPDLRFPLILKWGARKKKGGRKMRKRDFLGEEKFFPFLSLYLPPLPSPPIIYILEIKTSNYMLGRECPKDLLSVAVGPWGTGGWWIKNKGNRFSIPTSEQHFLMERGKLISLDLVWGNPDELREEIRI